MKKSIKKLALSTETIVTLNDSQLGYVVGGITGLRCTSQICPTVNPTECLCSTTTKINSCAGTSCGSC
jgi:hypothetical protein